jgi:hypothetical protein
MTLKSELLQSKQNSLAFVRKKGVLRLDIEDRVRYFLLLLFWTLKNLTKYGGRFFIFI